MYLSLVAMPVAWPLIDVFQVDERVVGEADERSNMRALHAAFGRTDIPPQQLHHMPVDAVPLDSGAAQYARELDTAAGTPPTLDVVHLGLGADGHTASLVPGDDALDAEGDVALTQPYMGVRRMTLTLGVLNRARLRVWLVTGRAKQEAVSRLMHAEPATIATRIRRDESILVLDEDAAAELK
jgi:6-phosphogluconolactonase